MDPGKYFFFWHSFSLFWPQNLAFFGGHRQISLKSNLSQLLDSHHLWSKFQLSAFHVWEKYTYLSSTHITLSSWLLTPGPQNPQFQLYHQSSPQGTDYKITMVTEVKHWVNWSQSILNFPTPLRSCWSSSVISQVSSATHRLCSDPSPPTRLFRKLNLSYKENINITS